MNYAYMGWNVIGGIKKTQKIYKLMKKYKHINRGNNNMDLTISFIITITNRYKSKC